MKTYYLYAQESNDTFFKEMNEFLDGVEKEDQIQIYINSGGGSCWLYDCMTRRLNEMVEDGYDITLRVIFIGSAAFILTYQFKGKVILEKEADGVVHITATNVDMWSDVYRSNDQMDIDRKNWRDKQPQLEYNFMTKKEKKHYLSGRDLWISPDRMKIIFKEVK